MTDAKYGLNADAKTSLAKTSVAKTSVAKTGLAKTDLAKSVAASAAQAGEASAAALQQFIDAASPFHEGEIAIQKRYGVAEKVGVFGRRAIRDHMTEQHRDFYAQLPTLVLGAVDAQGRPWATVVGGAPGFLRVQSDRQLGVDARFASGDPVGEALAQGAFVGGLGIEFETRRRNRFTARVAERSAESLTLSIDQTFGNCPKYIFSRAAAGVAARTPSAPARVAGLDDEARAMIAAADTFFVASAAPGDGDARRGADVSHRGGKPGFVQIRKDPDGDDELVIPDFSGNLLFNTFGNLLLNPQAGLTFIDFTAGDMLFLTGATSIQFDGPEIAAFEGAERIWRFRPTDGVRIRAALPVAFQGGRASPNNQQTGDWRTAGAALAAEAQRRSWRPFRIARVRSESAEINSLYLEPADGGALTPHQPGQHLPIRLSGHGQDTTIDRSYTLSDAFDGAQYRLSVKREPGGAASERLHSLGVGDVIAAQAPRGGFVLDEASPRPIVMISAGVGVTPMMAMLNTLLTQDGGNRHGAEVIFIHSARDGAAQAFGPELRRKAETHPRFRLHMRFSRPGPEDAVGRTHDSDGRIDKALLQSLLPLDDYDVYLCGPGGFMAAVYGTLRDLGVRDARIRFEAFGPSSVTRRPDPGAPAPPPEPADAVVTFAGSGVQARWTPDSGTLLDLAEANGITPPFSCRSGGCGSCATAVRKGAVTYRETPSAEHDDKTALICSARPSGPLTLDL